MGIINFFDLTDSFTLPPDEAVEFFESKGLQPTFSYLDMAAEEHDQAFTVAKMMDQDLLATTRDKLDQALGEGKTMQQFREELVPELQKAGWWGDQPITDPVTGQTVTSATGSTARLNNIFRTNIMSSYSVGHWQKIEEQKEEAPLLMYDAVDDFRTRPTHAQWDERVFSVDDPFWSAWMPPNGYQCRCGVVQINEDEASDFGLSPEGSPDLEREPWTNPRTGETRQVPKGIDPQFSHNPGLRRAQNTEQVSQEKFSILTPPEQQAIDLNQAAITSAQEASKRALINSPTGEKLQELSDQAAARTKQAKAAQEAAQAEIDKAIDQQTPWLAPAIKQVSKTQAAKDMNPAELLEEAKKKAKNNEQSALVANYKQNKINGKSISQSQQDAFDSLDETKRQAITEEIEVKSGNFQAKQQIEEFQSAGGFVAEKKAIKKLENEGALKGKEPKAQLKAIQEEAEAQKQAANQKALANSYKANIAKGKNPTDTQTAAFKALPEDQQQKLLDDAQAQKKELQAEATLADVKKEAEGEPDGDPLKVAVQAAEDTDGPATKKLSAFNTALDEAQEKASAPPAPASNGPDALQEVGPDMDEITQVGPAEGTNPGGRFLDPTTGQEWIIKTPDNPEIANNEVLAGKLYKAAGANAAEIERVQFKNRAAVASRVNPDAKVDPATLRGGSVQGINEDFAVDAWLANWDAVGEGFDNMMVAGNRAFRIDPGGALRYRAQGGLKGDAFGDTVSEIQTLRDPNMNRQAAEVFKDVTDDDIRAGVERIAAIDDETIRELIEEYGPASKGERSVLFNRLKARREDLKRRFPPKRRAEAPRAAGVSEGEVERIAEAKQNGYSLPTDKGEIEDQQILVWHQRTQDGEPQTAATFKVREKGLEKLNQKVSDEAAGDIKGGLDTRMNLALDRAAFAMSRGNTDSKQRERALDASRAINETLNRIEEEIEAGNLTAAVRDEFMAKYGAWRPLLDKMSRIGDNQKFDINTSELKPRGRFVPGGEIVPKRSASGLKFERKKGQGYTRKTIEDGVATDQDTDLNNPRTEFFEAQADDGTVVRFFNEDARQIDEVGQDSQFALQGRVQIETPGDDKAAANRHLEIMEELGLEKDRPSPLDEEELYLAQIANHQRRPEIIDDVSDLEQAQRIERLKDRLSEGLDERVDQLPGYKPAGARDPFENGRARRTRPDLEGPEWEEFAKEHNLYHENTGDMQMDDLLGVLLNSGGKLIGTTEKMRRGVPIGGMSPEADLESGGAGFFFTRIRQKRALRKEGFYFKADHLKRLDAVSFNHDAFGKQRGNYVRDHRKTGVDEWREASQQQNNETILKDEVSIFDRMDSIVIKSRAQRLNAIKKFRDAGITQWPDGRALEEVITDG